MDVHDLEPERLMELHGLALRAARKISEPDAEDVAQNTIAKLDDEDLDELPNLDAWVQRVAKNQALDLRKRNDNHHATSFDDEMGLDPQSFSTRLVAGQKVRDLLADLPEKYRRVLELTYYEALSAKEVGSVLGYKTSTVHKMLTEARGMIEPNVTAPPGYER